MRTAKIGPDLRLSQAIFWSQARMVGYKFCYGGKRGHFKMIVADSLINPLQINYKAIGPILLGAEKYARQNLSMYR